MASDVHESVSEEHGGEEERLEREATSLGIGARVRHARLMRGSRMKDLAEKANCSESLISKIENEKIQPSLNVLRRICEALGITVGELFAAPEDEDQIVTRRGQRPVAELDTLRRGNGLRLERVIPYSKGRLLQGNIHIIAPGGASDGQVSHQGEEVGYVIVGDVELLLGERSYRLGEGDTFSFRSEVPHGYRNVGEEEAQILFVNTPPSF